MEKTGLVKFDKARTALAIAKSVDEVVDIRNKAEAMRKYVAQANGSKEMQNQCAEIKLRAERRAGEMLKDTIPHKGGRPKNTDTMSALSEAGVTEKQSSRWQQEASVPEDVFEEYIENTKADGELTSSDVLKIAKKAKKDEELADGKKENAAQIAKSPDRPIVYKTSADKWLPEQEPCDLLITDPPYMTDVEDIAEFVKWLPPALDKVKSTGSAYIFVGAYPEELNAYFNVAMPCQVLVWTYKNTLGQSPKSKYKLNWQAILYYRMPDAGELNCPITNELWAVKEINAPDGRVGNREYKWQKPDDLAEMLIRHGTDKGDIIYDPYAGSGSFLLAACRLGRKGSGCEIDEDVIKIAKEKGCQSGQF